MVDEFSIGSDIVLTKNGLGIYLENFQTLVIADLHIGLEHAMMGEGTFLPLLQYPTIEKSIMDLIGDYYPKRLVINGDFKHEFAKASVQEWTEILNLWDSLSKKGVELELVRGNHDNYLINVLNQRGKPIHDPGLSIGTFLITHGHKHFEIPEDTKTIIMAHEHPAIGLMDESGGKHKFKCYLFGSYEDYEILVLPAYSPLAAGAIINSGTKTVFMSPFLAKIDISKFIPVILDQGEILRFPPLSELDPVRISSDFYEKLELDPQNNY